MWQRRYLSQSAQCQQTAPPSELCPNIKYYRLIHMNILIVNNSINHAHYYTDIIVFLTSKLYYTDIIALLT